MLSRSYLLALVALAACGNAAPPGGHPAAAPTPAAATPIAPVEHPDNHKPTAPVQLVATASKRAPERDNDDDVYDVKLTATPSIGLERLVLRIDGAVAFDGAASAGVPVTVVGMVMIARDAGADVVTGAITYQGGQQMSAAEVVHVGAPAAPDPTKHTTVTLPDGTVVDEARP